MRHLAPTLWCAAFALGLCALLAGAATGGEDQAGAAVSFRRDVVPALTKAGCNAGACHGSFQGRGGFRLSLLGFDPAADYETIALKSRAAAASSSPARKTACCSARRRATVPHGGGVRLTKDDPAYKILHDYIAAGLPATRPDEPQIAGLDVTPLDAMLKPGESTALNVAARWSDGSTRDVTAWALFDARDAMATEVTREGQITSLRPGKASVSVRYMGQVASVGITTPFGPPLPIEFAPAGYIDELVAAEWQRLGLCAGAAAPTASSSAGCIST